MATKYFIAPNAWGIFCGMDKTARIDSRTVAEVFEKRHDNVIQAIKNLEVSEDFRLLNFKESSYKNSPEFTALNFEQVKYKAKNGQKQPCYNMTRKGFTRLAFGFTGKKAAQFIEEYITRFDEMEELIRDKLKEKCA